MQTSSSTEGLAPAAKSDLYGPILPLGYKSSTNKTPHLLGNSSSAEFKIIGKHFLEDRLKNEAFRSLKDVIQGTSSHVLTLLWKEMSPVEANTTQGQAEE